MSGKLTRRHQRSKPKQKIPTASSPAHKTALQTALQAALQADVQADVHQPQASISSSSSDGVTLPASEQQLHAHEPRLKAPSPLSANVLGFNVHSG